MSALVVGLSHKTAPVALLERAALTGDAAGKLLHDVHSSQYVMGTFVVSTCNRVEVYADVDKFHGGVSAISELLARHTGIDLTLLTRHLYVHYEERAAQHLFAVSCGLDSMVTGEGQILGQVREALKYAEGQGTLARPLADLGRLALHAGKRAHGETGIDRAGASMVSVGIDLAARLLPTRSADEPSRPLDGVCTLVVGAGSMSALAVSTARRAGAASIVIANRSAAHAERLASKVRGATASLADLPRQIASADLVISCTGARETIITAEIVTNALAIRRAEAAADAVGVVTDGAAGVATDGAAGGGPATGRGPAAGLGPAADGTAVVSGPAVSDRAPDGRSRSLVLIDLALPRDIDPAVASLAGVAVIGFEDIRAASRGAPGDYGRAAYDHDIAAVRRIVAEEVAAHAAAAHAARVTPTVVALRAKAASVVDSELHRLGGRLTGASARDLDEVAKAMRRVVDKLLHAPTVRVKELAGSPGGDAYAEALRELFDLDPKTVEAVTRAVADLGTEGAGGSK